jgi:hypothetical protein
MHCHIPADTQIVSNLGAGQSYQNDSLDTNSKLLRGAGRAAARGHECIPLAQTQLQCRQRKETPGTLPPHPPPVDSTPHLSNKVCSVVICRRASAAAVQPVSSSTFKLLVKRDSQSACNPEMPLSKCLMEATRAMERKSDRVFCREGEPEIQHREGSEAEKALRDGNYPLVV